MPLNLVDKNKTYTIQRIAGKEEMIHRLEDLGFVPGSQVCVLSEIKWEVVMVRGAKMAWSGNM